MELLTADVRRFLAAAFSDEELDALCFDYFPRVYDDFAAGMTKGQKIQALIEHCQRHGAMDSLTGALQKERVSSTQSGSRLSLRLLRHRACLAPPGKSSSAMSTRTPSSPTAWRGT